MAAFGTMKELLQVALDEARRAGAGRVVALSLVARDNGSADAQSLSQQFQALAQGTLAENARLLVDCCASERHCWTCGFRYAGSGLYALCPQCGSPGLLLAPPDVLQLTSITIEKQVGISPVNVPAAIHKAEHRLRTRLATRAGSRAN